MQKFVEKALDTYFGHKDLQLVYLSLAVLAEGSKQLTIIIDEFAHCLEMDVNELRRTIVWLEKMDHIKIVGIKTIKGDTTFTINLDIERTEN